MITSPNNTSIVTESPTPQAHQRNLVQMHWRFGIVLLLFVLGVAAHQLTMPVMEGYDETLHYNYVSHLYTDNRLPDRTTQLDNDMRQESSQPPLGYWGATLFLRLFNVPPDYNFPLVKEIDDARNLWFTPLDEWQRRDNINVYMHGPAEILFGHPNMVLTDRVARLGSLFFGILAVIGAYGAACELFGVGSSWALVATAIFAFTPQMLNLSAIVSNDVSVTAFGSLVTWQALSLLRKRPSVLRLVIIGLLLGCAGLSKINGLLVGGGVGVALLLEWRLNKRSLGTLVRNSLIVGLATLLVVGPWIAWGLATYGSPFDLEAHDKFANPNLAAPSILQVGQAMIPLYASYWGRFGGGSLWMHPIIYFLLTIIVGIALLGYLRFPFRRLRWNNLALQQGLVLAAIVLGSFAGLMQWLLKLFAISSGIHGRLLYPAHCAIIMLLVGGLYCFVQRVPRRVGRVIRNYAVIMTALSGLILAPLDIYVAFAPPDLLAQSQLPALQGPQVDFDHTIRFLGYQQSTPYIYDGKLHHMTLCWEVLAATTRSAVLTVKILDGSASIGDRTTIPGMGHFNSVLWKPGDIFCDGMDIRLLKAPQPGQAYDVLVSILDWNATTPDGKAIDYARVAQVVSPAGDMSLIDSKNWQPIGISFPDLADLKGMVVNGQLQPGQNVKLDLLWKVTGHTPYSWSEFIHLIGPKPSGLADSIPRTGHYPTQFWSSGEQISETWSFQIPDGLPSGDYTIQIGFYRQDTGDRLRAEKDKQSIADNSALLLSFHVN